MAGRSPEPSRFTTVREVTGPGVAALRHPGWAAAFPWLVQGTTTRRSGDVDGFDFGLFAERSRPDTARARWRTLREWVGAGRVVHARQIHGAEVRVHGPVGSGSGRPGESPGGDPWIVDDCDGHVTASPGVLLAVTTADCVPIFLADAERRAVAAVHAGWRGGAAGILERALEAMATDFGTRPDEVYMHLGPAICGRCYEVGPEVFEALREPVPPAAMPIDLRHVLASRGVRAGVPRATITVSAHCTRCTGSDLFSHRGGDGGRQVGFIGLRS